MEINKLVNEAQENLKDLFAYYEEIALYNQEKVLNAFKDNCVALRHFNGTTGYGYDDIGRDTLNKVFATVFNAEDAIVSPYFTTGTHTISTALYGLLRPNDTLLSVSGMPYDTLQEVILGENNGSLRDFGVKFDKVELTEDGKFDFEAIIAALKNPHSVIFIQRSRGYNWRDAFLIEDIKEVIEVIRKYSDAPIILDNCYGEFTDKIEPLDVGANLIMGSLIKNPGGGLAPTGGYIAGRKDLIEKISFRLTAPGVGTEVGSYEHGYRLFYQGLFLAPHVTLQAIKAALTFAEVFKKLGYETLPKSGQKCGDIICSVKFDTAEQLISFVQSVQQCSPIDSFVTPYPWDMPGYSHQVIMAAGTFVQGASIELSADSPIKKPYIAYIQGGLTYEHTLIALKNCLKNFRTDQSL
ncbi:MAG: methionine gamma-lyase family protein [Clostridiales bacterium]|nr:methionine gamma-lyase family protein [Clostridiales bacterium]